MTFFVNVAVFFCYVIREKPRIAWLGSTEIDHSVDQYGKGFEDEGRRDEDLEGTPETLGLLLEEKADQGDVHEDGTEDEKHDAIVAAHRIALGKESAEADDNPTGDGKQEVIINLGDVRLQEGKDDGGDGDEGDEDEEHPSEVLHEPALSEEELLEDEASQDGGEEHRIEEEEGNDEEGRVQCFVNLLFLLILNQGQMGVIAVSIAFRKKSHESKDSGYNDTCDAITSLDVGREIVSLGAEDEKEDQERHHGNGEQCLVDKAENTFIFADFRKIPSEILVFYFFWQEAHICNGIQNFL